MNTAIVAGVLTEDPEIRYMRDGLALTRFEVRPDSGPSVMVECQGTLAENVALSIQADTRVLVAGSFTAAGSWPETPGAVLAADDVAASMRHATVEMVPRRETTSGQ